MFILRINVHTLYSNTVVIVYMFIWRCSACVCYSTHNCETVLGILRDKVNSLSHIRAFEDLKRASDLFFSAASLHT